MPNINLMPWRETKRQHQQKQFLQVSMLVILICILTLLLTGHLIRQQISKQQARNFLISNYTEQINPAIEEAETIRRARHHLLERLRIIGKLQQERKQIVEQLNLLTAVIPQQLYLTQLERQGNQLILQGEADGSRPVSELMRLLAQIPLLDTPTLTDISASQKYPGFNRFTLRIVSNTLQQEVTQ